MGHIKDRCCLPVFAAQGGFDVTMHSQDIVWCNAGRQVSVCLVSRADGADQRHMLSVKVNSDRCTTLACGVDVKLSCLCDALQQGKSPCA